MVARLTSRTESMAEHEPEGRLEHCFVGLLKASFLIKNENLAGRGSSPATRSILRQEERLHRKRLRQQGLRPIQIWVPDMRSPAFVTEAHRQSLAVANSQRRTKTSSTLSLIGARCEAR